MKALNKKAASILSALCAGLERVGQHRKIDNYPGTWMAVSIEVIDRRGGNLHISVAHYGEQNGDLMRDPEMIFIQAGGDFYPYYYRNDYVGFEQDAVEFGKTAEGEPFMRIQVDLQRDQTKFANMWMRNIQEQQGIEAEGGPKK